MRAGENIQYPKKGETLVTLPAVWPLGNGEVERVGEVCIDQSADLHFIDPDAHLVQEGEEIYYNGFRRSTPVAIEESSKKTSYIYKNNKGKQCYITIKAIGLEPINRVCPLCGSEPLHTVHCRRAGGMAVCEGHCTTCEYYQRGGCRYQKKPP